jgi:hypothetical protein
MNNPDHISESLETIFWVTILKFCDVDPGSGMKKFVSGIRDEKIRIRDEKIRIRDEKIRIRDPG